MSSISKTPTKSFLQEEISSTENIKKLLEILQERFEKNLKRHPKIKWEELENRLKINPINLEIIHKMEKTGGEPDAILFDQNSTKIFFVDCSKETPKERVSLCYDDFALESRKSFKPKNSAENMAKEIGIEILTEDEYFKLQEIEEFDLKTSSWLKTPQEIRKLGGAIFGDQRFGRVFIYHNGAESYYASRGFRGKLEV